MHEQTFTELIPLGIINYCVIHEDLIDNELAHTFLYKKNLGIDEFYLQIEEVSGIIKVKFSTLLIFGRVLYKK